MPDVTFPAPAESLGPALCLAQLSFGAPLLLLGLLVAAVPIVLHLRRSVAAPPLPFPAVRFLMPIAQRVARQRRVNRWLLLILRMLALGLLALALAQPSVRSVPWSSSPLRGSAVIVLDDSMSMTAGSMPDGPFQRAQAAALDLLARPDAPQHVAVLLPTSGAGPARFTDRDAAMDLVRSAEALPGGRPLASTLADAQILARQAPTRPAVIIVASDFAGLDPAPTTRPIAAESPESPTLLLPASDTLRDNLAITHIELTGDRAFVGTSIQVRLTARNFGSESAAGSVHVEVDGTPGPISPASFTLAAAGEPGDQLVKDLDLPLTRAGLMVGRALLLPAGGPDALPADDARWFGLQVRERLRVLLIADRATGWRDPAVFVATALAVTPSVDARRVTPAELTPADLAAADAIIVAASLTDAQAEQVRASIATGNSAVVFAARAEDNALVQLVGSNAANRRGTQTVTRWTTDHPIVAGLTSGGEMASVNRYVQIQPDVQTSVLAVLSERHPLIVSRTLDRGRLTVILTGPDTRTSDLPTQPLFVPLILRACGLTSEFAAVPAVAPGPQVGWNLGVRPAPEPLVVNPAAEESDLRLATPERLSQLAAGPVFIGESPAELAGQLEAAAAGTPLSDALLAIAIILAVGELLFSAPTPRTRTPASP